MVISKYIMFTDKSIMQISLKDVYDPTKNRVGWMLRKENIKSKLHNLCYHNLHDDKWYGKVIKMSNRIENLLQLNDMYFRDFNMKTIRTKEQLDEAKKFMDIEQIYKLNKVGNFIRYEVKK